MGFRGRDLGSGVRGGRGAAAELLRQVPDGEGQGVPPRRHRQEGRAVSVANRQQRLRPYHRHRFRWLNEIDQTNHGGAPIGRA